MRWGTVMVGNTEMTQRIYGLVATRKDDNTWEADGKTFSNVRKACGYLQDRYNVPDDTIEWHFGREVKMVFAARRST